MQYQRKMEAESRIEDERELLDEQNITLLREDEDDLVDLMSFRHTYARINDLLRS